MYWKCSQSIGCWIENRSRASTHAAGMTSSFFVWKSPWRQRNVHLLPKLQGTFQNKTHVLRPLKTVYLTTAKKPTKDQEYTSSLRILLGSIYWRLFRDLQVQFRPVRLERVAGPDDPCDSDMRMMPFSGLFAFRNGAVGHCSFFTNDVVAGGEPITRYTVCEETQNGIGSFSRTALWPITGQ